MDFRTAAVSKLNPSSVWAGIRYTIRISLLIMHNAAIQPLIKFTLISYKRNYNYKITICSVGDFQTALSRRLW